MDEFHLRFVVLYGYKLVFLERQHSFHICNRFPGRIKGLESPHGLELLLGAGIIRFNAIVQVFGGSVQYFLFQFLGPLQVFNGPRISLMGIRGHILRLRIVGLFERLLK
jgi:hypothetical protein